MIETELAGLFAAALGAAFVIGWLAHWIWVKLAFAASPQTERIEELAGDLLEAEAERDAVREDKQSTETTLTTDFSEREEELTTRLREREAELEAAMETLGEMRRELEAK
ncbi:MAG: hypothetical protein AAF401_03215 [Pseudomonadota bacterium]